MKSGSMSSFNAAAPPEARIGGERDDPPIHCEWASEILDTTGPTGRFREVIEAQAVDYGDNVLEGPHDVRRFGFRRPQVPHRLIPTKLGVLVASSDNLTSPHMDSENTPGTGECV